MDNNMKKDIMELIEKYAPIFKRVSGIEYRIRCPICGDSQKDLQKTRCYIKYTMEPGEPLVYMCHNCNSKGIINAKFLNGVGVPKRHLTKLEDQVFNKLVRIKPVTIDVVCGNMNLDSPQVRYIESRLGQGFTAEDYDKFKIIWDISALEPCISNQSVKNILPLNSNSISFLSEDKSMILVRRFVDDEPRWRKTRLFKSENRSLYTIKSAFDLFTTDMITVNIAEGVFDVLSVYKNFNDSQNNIFIATLGSSYDVGIEYAINHGILGKNVNIKIYIDNDVSVYNLRRHLRKYKWLFNNIQILNNTLEKDVGVPLDRIQLSSKWI